IVLALRLPVWPGLSKTWGHGVNTAWAKAAMRKSPLPRLFPPEGRVPQQLADLHRILGIEALAGLFLGGAVLRMHAPGAHALLALEFDDGHPLAIVGEEALVRDVAGHGAGDLVHARGEHQVLLAHVGHQARAEHRDDHFLPPSNTSACSPAALDRANASLRC